MKVTNPFINQARENGEKVIIDSYNENAATKRGVAGKTLFLLLLAIISGSIVAIILNRTLLTTNTNVPGAQQALIQSLMVWLFVCLFLTIISMLVGRLVPSTARYMAPVYSVAEGSLLGVICTFAEIYLPGVTIAAGAATGILFLLTLLVYNTGLKNHMSGVFRFFFIYFISLMLVGIGVALFLMFNNVSDTTYFYIDLAISAAYLLYALIMLVLTFDEAEMIVKSGIEKKYEWTVALGLIYTILYLFEQVLYIILIIAQHAGRSNN